MSFFFLINVVNQTYFLYYRHFLPQIWRLMLFHLLKCILKYIFSLYIVQNQPMCETSALPHNVIRYEHYSKSPFCIHLLLTGSCVCPALHADVVDEICVSLCETWDRTRAETRVHIGGLKSRPCSLSSLKVISTHKMECSLVFFFFINRADRFDPENQMKNLYYCCLWPCWSHKGSFFSHFPCLLLL